MILVRRIIISLSSILALVACGTQNAETGFKQQSAHESASNEATKELEGSADASGQTNRSELIGTWFSPCLPGPGFNLKITVQYSPTEVVKTNYRYDDDICNSLFLKEIGTDRYTIVEEDKTTMSYKTDSHVSFGQKQLCTQ